VVVQVEAVRFRYFPADVRNRLVVDGHFESPDHLPFPQALRARRDIHSLRWDGYPKGMLPVAQTNVLDSRRRFPHLLCLLPEDMLRVRPERSVRPYLVTSDKHRYALHRKGLTKLWKSCDDISADHHG